MNSGNTEYTHAVNVTNCGSWTTHYCRSLDEAEKVRQEAEDTLPGEALREGVARATISVLS